MKLSLPLVGSRARTLSGAAASADRAAGQPGRAERVRKLMLATAAGTMLLLLALALTSGAVRRPELSAVPVPAVLVAVEPTSGLSWLQIIGAASGAAAALLLLRRIRVSNARHRATTVSPTDMAAQAALVAAWINKANRELERTDEVSFASQSIFEAAPSAAPVPVPMYAPLQGASDPTAAIDFVKWGQQAARAGDRMVGYRLFLQAVRLDRGNEHAWLWLAATTNRRDEAINALERVIGINPENHAARQGLGELRAQDRP